MIRIYNLWTSGFMAWVFFFFFVLCEYLIRACTCTLLSSTSEPVEKSEEFALYTWPPLTAHSYLRTKNSLKSLFLACLFLVLNCASTYGYAESVKSFSDLEMVWWTTSKHLSLSQLCLKSVMNVGQKRSLTQTFWEYLCELELFFSSQNMKSAGVCGCGFVWDSIAKWFIITPPDKHLPV